MHVFSGQTLQVVGLILQFFQIRKTLVVFVIFVLRAKRAGSMVYQFQKRLLDTASPPRTFRRTLLILFLIDSFNRIETYISH